MNKGEMKGLGLSGVRLLRKRMAAVAALCLALGAFAAPAGRPQSAARSSYPRFASQQDAQAITKPLQYEVSVVLKLIHVYVTDKKGNPIRDLRRDEFSVTDNGKPVVVTDFEIHTIQAPAEGAQTKPGPGETPETAPAKPAAETAPVMRPAARKFFLFFDFAYNNARGAVKAQKAGLHFLDDAVRPGDEVAVMSYSSVKGLAIQEYLTTDLGKVRKVLDAMGHGKISGRATDIENQYWILTLDTGPSSARDATQGSGGSGSAAGMGALIMAQNNLAREESRSMARQYMARLTALAQSMRLIPGQKHFILFSTGVPNSLINGFVPGNPRYRGGDTSGDKILRDLNEAMYKEFSAAGCAFYAFDTREASIDTQLFAFDEATLAYGSRSMGATTTSTSVFTDDKLTGLNSLKRLTDLTGGKYFSNINRFDKNLDQVQGLTGTYYVLGYSIGEQWDGQFHELKVEVKRKGCEVRAQAGYFSPKPYAQYTKLEKELQLYDLALNERAAARMPVNIPMRALPFAAGGPVRLGILAGVPGEVTGKFSGRRVEFVAIFFDAKGEIAGMAREECDALTHRGRDVVFAAGATLVPGEYSCRLVIRDMDTGVSAVGSAKATVVAAPAGGLRLSTPLVIAEGRGGAFIEADSGRAKDTLTLAGAYPFDQLRYSPVLGEVPFTAERIRVMIPFSLEGTGEPDLAVSAYLVNAASGERTPLDVSGTDRAKNGELDILTLEIPVGSVAPGTYFLHISLEDRASKSLGHTSTSLVIPKR